MMGASRSTRSVLALGLLATACADGAPSVRVDAGDPAPVIHTFRAEPALVLRGETSLLSWDVEGADRVEISGANGTLVSTLEPAGSVRTPALLDDSAWSLVAERGSSVSTSSVTVGIAWQPITIEDVRVDPRSGFIGDAITISWSATNAVRVRVLLGDRLLVDRPAELDVDRQVVPIVAEDMTLTFELSNPGFVETRELIARGIPRPVLERFVVRPRALFPGGSRTTTITWSVRDTRSTELWIDQVAIPAFPGTLSGTVAITFDEAGFWELALVANTGREFTWLASRSVQRPGFEREPNHDLERSNDLTGSGAAIGQILGVDDTDFYSYQPYAGGRFRVSTTGRDGVGCTTDTRIHVTDFGGQLLVEAGEGGAPTDHGGACARLELALGVPGGSAPPIVIVVSGEAGDTGDYAVIVEDL